MRKSVKLTERRLRNKRFRKTEEAILEVVFNGNVYISMDEMAKRIGVSRSTVYRHHSAIKEIIPDYEKYLLGSYRKIIRKALRNGETKTREAYGIMLLFMVRNKRFFRALLKNRDREILVRMVVELRLKIRREARITRGSGLVFMVYANEIVAVLVDWAERGFSRREIEEVLDKMMYLTNTARVRLVLLEKMQ